MKKYIKRFFIPEITILIISISLVAQQEKPENSYVSYPVSKTQDTTLLESIARGKEIYTDFCMQCHLPDGKGSPNVFPPLAGSDWLTNKRKESIYAIKYGLSGPIKVNEKTYNNAMASLGLENEEIADVMNYIMNSWENTQKKMVTVEEVAGVKK